MLPEHYLLIALGFFIGFFIGAPIGYLITSLFFSRRYRRVSADEWNRARIYYTGKNHHL